MNKALEVAQQLSILSRLENLWSQTSLTFLLLIQVAVARYELIALRNTHRPADEASGSTNPFDNPLTYIMPTFENGRELKNYQVESVRWMAGHFLKRRSCILGDEVRLGEAHKKNISTRVLRQ